jgi:hypothetical protein
MLGLLHPIALVLLGIDLSESQVVVLLYWLRRKVGRGQLACQVLAGTFYVCVYRPIQ